MGSGNIDSHIPACHLGLGHTLVGSPNGLCKGAGAIGVWILVPGTPPGSITHTSGTLEAEGEGRVLA